MKTFANCNILRKMIFVWRQVGVCTWFQEGGGGLSFAHVLILISHSLYIFRSLQRKISVKPAVQCQAQSFILTWAPCYIQSARSVWWTSVAGNTSHIAPFCRGYSHCFSSVVQREALARWLVWNSRWISLWNRNISLSGGRRQEQRWWVHLFLYLQLYYCVTPVVFSVGEWKSVRILLSVLVLVYMRKLFLQCALHPLQRHWGFNWQSDSQIILTHLQK